MHTIVYKCIQCVDKVCGIPLQAGMDEMERTECTSPGETGDESGGSAVLGLQNPGTGR